MSDGLPKQNLGAVSHHTLASSTVTKNATIKLTSLDQYTSLRSHRLCFKDAFDLNAERVDTANKLDIIFGRGKSLQDHPGNQRMRQITNKYKQVYHSLQRSQKRNLVENVYKEIVAKGARFLTKAPNAPHFLLVDVEVALQKISSSLRRKKNQKRQLQLAQELQNSSNKHPHIVNAGFAISSPPLQSAGLSIPSKIEDERSPTRECWNPCSPYNSLATAVIPSIHVVTQTPNICDILTKMQHLNQCRRLRLMMDARIDQCRRLRLMMGARRKSSILVGRAAKASSSQSPSNRSTQRSP